MARENAFGAGLVPSEFWASTFHEVSLYTRAQSELTVTRDLSQAYYTAGFSRAKQLPNLQQLIRQATRGDPYARTAEEARIMEEEMRTRLRSLSVPDRPNGEAH